VLGHLLGLAASAVVGLERRDKTRCRAWDRLTPAPRDVLWAHLQDDAGARATLH